MPNPDFSYLACVIDRSGSMDSIKSDAIGGFNSFLEAQKKVPGTAIMTIVLFDDQYEKLCDAAPLQEVKPLTDNTFVPRGSTALLDAIGRTIDELGLSLAAMPEDQRPGNVIVAILTDGYENASRVFTREQIFDKITHQQTVYQWQFEFLAANQDAIEAGREIGIAADDTTSFDATSQGVHYAMAEMNHKLSIKRNRRT